MSIASLVGQMALGVCLQLASVAEAAPNAIPVFVPVQEFTLAWQHSIEKVRWEEDYQIKFDDSVELPLKADFSNTKARVSKEGSQPLLFAKEARIKGSAAGMEPPEGAVFKQGWYHYKPVISEHLELRLTRSEFVPDYEWCDQAGCRSLAEILPSDGGVTLMWACAAPQDEN